MTAPSTRSADPNKIAVRIKLLSAGDASASVSNTFYYAWIGSGSPVSVDWTNAMQDTIAFYNGLATGQSAQMRARLGKQISTASNAHEAATYQLDVTDIHHAFGSPVSVLPFTISAVGTGGAWPQESAAVLSFRADYGTDPEHEGTTRPRASDRGRIYFGPLAANAATGVVTPLGTTMTVLSPDTVSDMIVAGKALFAATNTHHWRWSVWSRSEHVLKPIADIAVDNDVDTQRRRSSGQGLQQWQSILAP